MEEKPIHILVVEDEPFQRLVIMDILSMLEYEVTVVNDGHEAWTILNEKGDTFDLVLLDLVLPGMDGLELLTKLKESPNLKDKPVVMVSAHNEMDKIYASIDLGALDFLMKPIRPGAVKGVVSQIKTQPRNLQNDSGTKTYEKIQHLGRGAYATVDLVKHKITGELRALKRINLQFLNEKERRNAENEAILMKVLVAPTIIHFYEQIVEDYYLIIAMEYAPGGALADKLQELRNQGKRITNDQLIGWLSQILIALMVMHSKHILHRDLKTQNLFLSSENIIKVGDLGIAKSLNSSMEMAQSVAGTPYNMAPEIIKGESYGPKTDIWSLGCVMYEIATFRRPFEATDVQKLFDVIANKDYAPLPEYVDSNTKLLISQMLNKDPARRPTVWDLANNPVIRDTITSFIKAHNCVDTIMPLFDNDPRYKKRGTNNMTSGVMPVGDIASLARNEMNLQDKKVGWFGKVYRRVFVGSELLNFLQTKFKFTVDQAKNSVQEMLEQGLITSIDKNTVFSAELIFQFREDRSDVARNMIYLWNKEVRVPSVVAKNLIKMLNELLVFQHFNAEMVRASSEYRDFLKALVETQRVEIRGLTRLEKIEFFLAIYQIMNVHQNIELEDTKSGWFSNPADGFYYNIAYSNFTLFEMKHGVLRGNRKPPGSYTRVFYNGDIRNMLPNYNDPRILLVCRDFPSPLQTIIDFFGRSEEMLDEKTEEFCNREVCLNLAIDELVLPKVFQTYAQDFGNSEEQVLRWVWRYFTACKTSIEEVLQLIKKQRVYILYRDWD
jgi:NIMA (never in mitosis gene a)-related kinase